MPALTAGKDASARLSCSAFAASSCSILMPMYGRTTRPCACSCSQYTQSQAAADKPLQDASSRRGTTQGMEASAW